MAVKYLGKRYGISNVSINIEQRKNYILDHGIYVVTRGKYLHSNVLCKVLEASSIYTHPTFISIANQLSLLTDFFNS
jgi:hypothetical protein